MRAASASAVAIPAALGELAKDHEVAPVDGDHLPVAAATRRVGPPAILDEPRLANRDDLMVIDRLRAPAGAGEDGGGARDAEAAGAGAHGRAPRVRVLPR